MGCTCMGSLQPGGRLGLGLALAPGLGLGLELGLGALGLEVFDANVVF